MNEPFPLLLKFIHAAEYLSVQVHPDDDQSERLEGVRQGKTEAWYILNADSNADIVLGVNPSLTMNEFKTALSENRIKETLHFVEANANDIFYMHTGLMHTIGPGITLFEIQQNSDMIYRFYDWDRMGLDGKHRPLHIEKALEVLDVGPFDYMPFRGLRRSESGVSINVLAAGNHFCLEKWDVTEVFDMMGNPNRFEIITMLGGRGRVIPAAVNSDPAVLTAGQSCLLPAHLGGVRIMPEQGGLSYLRSYIPDIPADIIAPLIAAGHSLSSIARLAGFKSGNELAPYVDEAP